MKVLVTGANGFVGSALCPYLSALGHSVVPVVRRAGGIVGERIVADAASWAGALAGCDSIIHLAGRAHVMHEPEADPVQAFRAANVALTLSLADAAVAAGVRRFVFMSTCKVNGEETVPGAMFGPTDKPAPQGAYAMSKWEAEQGLLEIAQKTGLEVVIIRPPLVYGPGVKGNFSSLLRWVQSGVPLPFGAVHNRRAMIALDNLVSFTALCADMGASPNAKGQVFLLSDGVDVSTTVLLRQVAQAYHCSSRLIPVPVGLMRRAFRSMGQAALADRLFGSLVVDDSQARQLLGWHPPFSMNQQLQKMALHDSLA